jgi:hypothetical protein
LVFTAGELTLANMRKYGASPEEVQFRFSLSSPPDLTARA